MAETFSDRVIGFNRNLNYTGAMPDGFMVVNPYLDNPETMTVMSAFYGKYYNDTGRRRFMIGINPSRHGAGVTGVPFTDTKRLESVCGIRMESARTHEVSSVFMYDMIAEYGGIAAFCRDFYINSPFPLAILRRAKGVKGEKETGGANWLNANYYDDPRLFEMTEDFMIDSLRRHIGMGLDTSEVFVLGKKNAVFIEKMNRQAKLFGRLTVLEHPRFIQQYKSKEKRLYIDKYILALNDSK